MGAEMNPLRAFVAVATVGTSEAIIEGAQLVGKVVPFPTTCCGCPCGHIGTVGWRFCHVCGEDVKFF